MSTDRLGCALDPACRHGPRALSCHKQTNNTNKTKQTTTIIIITIITTTTTTIIIITMWACTSAESVARRKEIAEHSPRRRYGLKTLVRRGVARTEERRTAGFAGESVMRDHLRAAPCLTVAPRPILT